MVRRLAVSFTFFLSLSATEAVAACHPTFDCTSGQCRQTQVCDSSIDMPAIAPPSIPPLVAPSITPIMPPALPPIGASSCAPARLCNNYGQCSWQQVCQ